MKVRFLEIAQAEFENGVDYYNQESPGLGYEFADEVLKTIARITSNPSAWQPLSKRTRRCLTHRFPYGVIYQIRADALMIVAVMHLHRHPDSWKNRTSTN